MSRLQRLARARGIAEEVVSDELARTREQDAPNGRVDERLCLCLLNRHRRLFLRSKVDVATYGYFCTTTSAGWGAR